MSPYKVMVDDNYHYMDESERYELGIFSTVEEAIAACKRIVDEFLDKSYEPGMSAETLEKAYQGFGEDPFIIALGESSDNPSNSRLGLTRSSAARCWPPKATRRIEMRALIWRPETVSAFGVPVIPGRVEDANLRCAIAHRGISRFRVQPGGLPRNDDVRDLALRHFKLQTSPNAPLASRSAHTAPPAPRRVRSAAGAGWRSRR